MQDLTSRLTFGYKFVYPPLGIGFFASYTLAMFIAPDVVGLAKAPLWLRWYMAGATVLVAAYIYRTFIQLKVVSRDGTDFVVSNYWRTIRVPMRDVERVSGHMLTGPELISLHFRRPTEFGSKIMFMPKQRAWGGFTRHPLVKQLSALVHSHEVASEPLKT